MSLVPLLVPRGMSFMLKHALEFVEDLLPRCLCGHVNQRLLGIMESPTVDNFVLECKQVLRCVCSLPILAQLFKP